MYFERHDQLTRKLKKAADQKIHLEIANRLINTWQHILKAWTNSQECSRKLLYLGELNFPLHQSSMYLQVSKWPPDLLICSMPHCVTKFIRNWTMHLTYSRPTNNIPARIPYHFHVEANKSFVRCHTWVHLGTVNAQQNGFLQCKVQPELEELLHTWVQVPC